MCSHLLFFSYNIKLKTFLNNWDHLSLLYFLSFTRDKQGDKKNSLKKIETSSIHFRSWFSKSTMLVDGVIRMSKPIVSSLGTTFIWKTFKNCFLRQNAIGTYAIGSWHFFKIWKSDKLDYFWLENFQRSDITYGVKEDQNVKSHFWLSMFFLTFRFLMFWSFDVLIILTNTFDVLIFQRSDFRRSVPPSTWESYDNSFCTILLVFHFKVGHSSSSLDKP
jgi:hypothetical protein